MAKEIKFETEFNKYSAQPRNDGNILKMTFTLKATDAVVPKLMTAYVRHKVVRIDMGQGEEMEVGRVSFISEFANLSAVRKNDGDIVRLTFVMRAHDEAVPHLLGIQGERVTVELDPEAGQDSLFPEEEGAYIEDDEDQIELEGVDIITDTGEEEEE